MVAFPQHVPYPEPGTALRQYDAVRYSAVNGVSVNVGQSVQPQFKRRLAFSDRQYIKGVHYCKGVLYVDYRFPIG